MLYEMCKLINETGNVAPDLATLRRRDLAACLRLHENATRLKYGNAANLRMNNSRNVFHLFGPKQLQSNHRIGARIVFRNGCEQKKIFPFLSLVYPTPELN
ncbi:hypothetical protein NQ318_008758 [Aromia moschata]|uniref:Uncharacterized protein n=1 Tax=Aromia moschata TaxID=1265417 RepID=A0AAV8ZA09_9CUCU|nr:hypothetical protein NQ318_008758 [Aromia moschata]